ncbi:MAG: hypothetical protein K2X43_14245 [Hyphomonadaceae bacterium]|jgi:hypothetical protein|nr:hypothetical protein [Hyphomonadaceae bacterium]
MLRNANQSGRLLVLAGGAAAILAGAGALWADLMVSHGFGKVLGAQKVALPFEVAAQGGLRHVAQVGDEGYWLTRAEVESPAPFGKRLAVGDRITISGRDGRVRTLEVIDLKAIGEPLTKAVTGAAPMRLLLVTCRSVEASEPDAQAPVRFIIEGEPVEPPAVAPSPAPKAL